MMKRILFVLAIVLSSIIELSAQAQVDIDHVVSRLNNNEINSIVSEGYLTTLETRLDEITNTNQCDIIVKFNDTPIKVTSHPEELTETYRTEITQKIKNANISDFRRLYRNPSAGDRRKKIIIYYDFKFFSKPTKDPKADNYFCQTIATSPTIKQAVKDGLNSFNQQGKLVMGNLTDNEAYINATINYIQQLLINTASIPDNVYQFGPLIVTIDNNQAVSPAVMSGAMKKYTSSDVAFNLKLKSAVYATLNCQITDATISYFYDDITGAYDQVQVTMPGHDPVVLGNMNVLHLVVKAVDLRVNTVNGVPQLSGSATLQAPVTEDIRLNSLFTMKPGFNGTIAFNYTTATPDFAGTYNFSGITGVKIDIAKFGMAIGSIQGALAADGSITAPISVTNKTCSGAFYTLNLTTFNINVTYSVFTGIKLNSGELTGSVSGIPGLVGELGLSGSVSPVGEINTLLRQEGTNLSICGAVLTNIQGGLALTPDLDFKFFEGTCALNIPRGGLNSAVAINKIYIDKNGVAEFDGSGIVEYESFTFNISKVSYANSSYKDERNNVIEDETIVFSASMRVNTTGSDVNVAVSEFKIHNGEVTIGEIKGDIIAGCFLEAEFIAKYTKDSLGTRFSGYVEGELMVVGVLGIIDIAHVKTTSSEYYSCYLKLNLGRSDGRGVPLAPLPLDLYKLGAEFGYNYRIDFSVAPSRRPNPAQPGVPERYTYGAGMTLGISIRGGLATLDANPIMQISLGPSPTLEIAMLGELKVPAQDEWFTADLVSTYKFPACTYTGSINVDFQLPKYNGVLVDSRNLGFDFKLYKDGNPQKYYWYVGRRGMQLVLLRVLTIDGDLEFKGPMDDMRLWSAYLRAQSTFRFRWTGTQNITFMSYELVRGSAGIDLSATQACSLAVSKDGLSGMMSMDIRAEGYVDLDLFPTLNSDWSRLNVGLLGNVGGTLGFRNTTVTLNGYLNARATVCGETSDFRIDLNYSYNPTTGSSSSVTGGTLTYSSPPVTSLTYPGENTFRPGDLTAIREFVASRNQPSQPTTTATTTSSSGYDRYRTLVGNIKRLKRDLPNEVNDISSFDTKLRTYATAILTRLNTSTYTTVKNFYNYVKGHATEANNFRTGSANAETLFNSWYATNGQEDPESTDGLLAEYELLQSNLEEFESVWTTAAYHAFEDQLADCGSTILLKLNRMSDCHNLLQSLQLYFASHANAPTQFASNYSQFEEWLNARSSTGNEKNDIFWMDYSNIKKYFTSLSDPAKLGESRLNSFLNSLKKCSTVVVASFNTKRPEEAVLIRLCELFEADYTKPADFKATPAHFETWYTQNSTIAVAVELVDADLAGATDPDQETNEATYSDKVTYADAVVMVIHGSGSTFIISVNDEIVEVSHRSLATWMRTKNYDDNKILLLSCSDLTAAHNLSNKLNQSVIATDGAVRVYSDGGVLGIDENGNVTPWVECLPGNRTNTSITQPRAPGNTSLSYVPLGEDREKSKKILIIGEGQDCVDEAARIYREAGYIYAESMMYPTSQWRGGNSNTWGTQSALDAAIAWNKSWMQRKISEGYIIIDIGADGRNSVFYQAELEVISATSPRPSVFVLRRLPNNEEVNAMRSRIGCASEDNFTE